MRNIDELPLIMRAEHVAEALNISKNGAYELFKQTDFPTITIGRQKRVNRDAFIEWTKVKKTS